jgi:ABC-type transporter Mla MlaB component
MFRITTRGADGELVLTLEGYLTGAWVQELETSWHTVVTTAPGAQLRVDLTGLCRVDAAGRELLAAMHRGGARLAAKGFVMPVLVREISESADAGGVAEGRATASTCPVGARSANPGLCGEAPSAKSQRN